MLGDCESVVPDVFLTPVVKVHNTWAHVHRYAAGKLCVESCLHKRIYMEHDISVLYVSVNIDAAEAMEFEQWCLIKMYAMKINIKTTWCAIHICALGGKSQHIEFWRAVVFCRHKTRTLKEASFTFLLLNLCYTSHAATAMDTYAKTEDERYCPTHRLGCWKKTKKHAATFPGCGIIKLSGRGYALSWVPPVSQRRQSWCQMMSSARCSWLHPAKLMVTVNDRMPRERVTLSRFIRTRQFVIQGQSRPLEGIIAWIFHGSTFISREDQQEKAIGLEWRCHCMKRVRREAW